MTNKLRLTSITASLLMCMTLVACGGGSGGGATGSTAGEKQTTEDSDKKGEESTLPKNGVSVTSLTGLLENGIQQYPTVASSPDGNHVIAAWTQGNQIVIKPDPMSDGDTFFNSPITDDRFLSNEITIAVNDNGLAIVAWVERGNESNPKVWYRTIDINLGTASDANEIDSRLTNVIDNINLSINNNGDGLVTFKGVTSDGAGLMASLFNRATQNWDGANIIYKYTANVIGQTFDDSGRAMIGFEYLSANYRTYQQGSGWGSVALIPFDIERKDEANIGLGSDSNPTLAFVENNGPLVTDDGISTSVFDWATLNWKAAEVVGESAYKIHDPALTLGADGKLYLTSLAKSMSAGVDKILITQQDSNGWNKSVVVTENPGTFVLGVTAQVDGQGDYSVMWTNSDGLFRELFLATSIAGETTIDAITDSLRGIVDYAQVVHSSGQRQLIWSEANYQESVVFMRKDDLN